MKSTKQNLKFEELITGRIYYHRHGYIVRYGGVINSNMTSKDYFLGGASWCSSFSHYNDGYRDATREEIERYEACERAGEYVKMSRKVKKKIYEIY